MPAHFFLDSFRRLDTEHSLAGSLAAEIKKERMGRPHMTAAVMGGWPVRWRQVLARRFTNGLCVRHPHSPAGLGSELVLEVGPLGIQTP